MNCDLSGDEYYVTERVSDLTSGSLWIGVPKNRKEVSYVGVVKGKLDVG